MPVKLFYPGWRLQPGQKTIFWSRLESPTGTKGYYFIPVEVFNRDKRSLSTLYWLLDFRPGTKAFVCPGSNNDRDKCVGTKPCFVVVNASKIRIMVKSRIEKYI